MKNYETDYDAAETVGEFDAKEITQDHGSENEAWKQTWYLHAVAALDRSDSMNEGNKIGELNDAIPGLLSACAVPQNNDSLFLSTVIFNHEATEDHSYELAKNISIAPLTANGGTNINNVLEVATKADKEFRDIMASDGRLPLKPTLIIMTDGQAQVDDHLLMIAKERFVIIPIGFGRDADRSMLRKLSSDGTFISADNTPGRLAEVFAKVGQTVSAGLQTAN